MLNPGVVVAICVVGVRGDPHHYYSTWQHMQTIIDRQLKQIMENQYQSLTKKLDCTTRVTTYTHYMYCCHNTGIEHQDFKFSVF